MERQFCINWAAIIEEARQRRKQQRLTQARLAEMAGVSTPTLSRFENGEKDIQLSTIIRILTVLGMIDQRELIFMEPGEQYDSLHDVVIFTGQDRGKKVQCGISGEALKDYYGGDKNKDLLKVFQAHRDSIEQETRRKYLSEKFESDGSVLVKSQDLG